MQCRMCRQETKFSWTHENATASGIDTTDNGVIYSTSNGNDHYFHMTSGTGSIGHTVNSGDVIEIRYRTTNVPSSLRNTTQSFEFWYTTTSSDSSFSSSMVLKANATVQEGTWQTVQFTPSSGITLKRVMFDFLQESKGFSGTKLEIDYMYIGNTSPLVMKNHSDKTFLSQSALLITTGVTRNQIVLKDKTNNTQNDAEASCAASGQYSQNTKY